MSLCNAAFKCMTHKDPTQEHTDQDDQYTLALLCRQHAKGKQAYPSANLHSSKGYLPCVPRCFVKHSGYGLPDATQQVAQRTHAPSMGTYLIEAHLFAMLPKAMSVRVRLRSPR